MNRDQTLLAGYDINQKDLNEIYNCIVWNSQIDE